MLKNLCAICYPLLMAFFPVIFLYAKNVYNVKLDVINKLLVKIAIILSLLFLLLFSYLKNIDKTAFSLFLIIYLFYSSKKIYIKLINRKLRPKKLSKYLYIISLFLTCLLVVFLIKKIWINFSVVSVMLFFILFFISLPPLTLTIQALNKLKNNKLIENNSIKSKQKLNSNYSNMPDIYYFVPDMYLKYEPLKNLYNYDNKEFYDYLESKGFYINKKGLSNYTSTGVSLASSLNMDYIDNILNSYDINKENYSNHLLYKLNLNNKLAQKMKELNYKYIRIFNAWELGYSQEDNLCDVAYKSKEGINEFLKHFLKETFFGLFEEKMHLDRRIHTLKQFQILKDISTNFKCTKFVFSHIMCPHPPYLFTKDGKLPIDKNDDPFHPQLYVDQLHYLNKHLKEIIDIILKINPNSIIIIQSDHGIKGEELDDIEEQVHKNKENNYINKDIFNRMFGAFGAYYMPDKAYNIFDEVRTPVNMFRAILNHVYNLNYELLEEEQYVFYMDKNEIYKEFSKVKIDE